MLPAGTNYRLTCILLATFLIRHWKYCLLALTSEQLEKLVILCFSFLFFFSFLNTVCEAQKMHTNNSKRHWHFSFILFMFSIKMFSMFLTYKTTKKQNGIDELSYRSVIIFPPPPFFFFLFFVKVDNKQECKRSHTEKKRRLLRS